MREVIAHILSEAKEHALASSIEVLAPYRDPNGTPEMGMTRSSTPATSGQADLAEDRMLSAIEREDEDIAGDTVSVLP